jgi:arabinofuranan 3-O-arabinosyltransferase
VLTQARYGVDFLQFTEQPGTIWGSTSLSESLRLMGYWVSYIGVGYTGHLRPYFSDAHVMAFQPLVVLPGLLVPALAIGALPWTRRWRYAPFFLALLLLGLAIMAIGFPEGTPLRRAVTFVYNRVDAVQFLRTTYKAGPLVAVALAALLGAGAAWLAARLRARPPLLAAAAAVLLALLVLQSWPLVRGRAMDDLLLWDRIPAAWTDGARDLDRDLPPGTRAAVLPGQLFGFSDWGATIDHQLPALAERPVAVRNVVPYADLHAIDLLWSTDALLQQGRAVPGQLDPLLDLMSVGAVVSSSDDERALSGTMPPGRAARLLAGQGYGAPTRAYGPRRQAGAAEGELAPPVRLPQVRRYDRPGAPGIVRFEPRRPSTVVDGSAWTLAGLAAFGEAARPLAYAADRTPDEIRAAARSGAAVVIGDSNRRRVLVASRLRQNAGWTLGRDDPISEDAAVLDPFGRGTDSQTLSDLVGARYLRAPFSPGFSQFPEHRPAAAFDGDPSTAWLADRSLDPPRRWVEIGFERPRDVPYVDVLPFNDERGRVIAIEAGGRTVRVGEGWTRIRLGLHDVRALRVRVAATEFPPDVSGGAGGFRELRVPGVRVRERLRPPVLAERALAGTDLSRTPLTYLFERTTGDDPFERDPVTGPPQAALVRDRGDAERAIRRVIHPPAAREWRAEAWVTAAPEASDSLLDDVAGRRGGPSATGSPRYASSPRWRASRAFDGDRTRPWVGAWASGRPAWVRWQGVRPVALRRLTLVPAPLRIRRPTLVRVSTDASRTPALPVAADGTVRLPRAMRTRTVRIDVLQAAWPSGTPGLERRRRGVGIAEVVAPGLEPVRVPRSGRLRASCGAASWSSPGGRARLALRGTVQDLDAGRPLRAVQCDPAVALPARAVEIGGAAGPFRPYWLALRSGPPGGRVPEPAPPGRVTDQGSDGRGSRQGVRVAATAPGTLVLGESYNRGWRATCDGRDLGRPKVVDGFANGWDAPADCRRAGFRFGPDRAALAGYGISALACLALLALLLLRRPPAVPAPGPDLADGPAPRGLPLGRAAALGLAIALPLGFVLALRAGLVAWPVVTLILWRGLGAGLLLRAAGALLLVVVPLLYLAIPPEDQGGYNTQYAVDRIAAHWVTAAAWALLVLALWRMLSAARRPSGGRADGPAA